MPDVTYSFLFVNFNMWGLLEKCIHALFESLENDEPYEIVVADNSTDPAFAAPENCAGLYPQIKLLRLAENRGWVHALNQALPLAAGRFVIIMHPDVEVTPGCLARLRGFLEAHPRAGIVGPDLSYPDGTPNAIRTRFPTLGVELRRIVNILTHIVLKRKFIRDELLWNHERDARVDMVMSVLMMVRHEVLSAIGPIDERLWTYYANDWLCARAGKLGWTCHYVAGAKAIHYERHANQRLYSSAEASSYKRSSMPVSDRMFADKFIFLQQVAEPLRLLAFRLLATCEFLIHIAAQLKRPREERNVAILKLWATIRAVWRLERKCAVQDS